MSERLLCLAVCGMRFVVVSRRSSRPAIRRSGRAGAGRCESARSESTAARIRTIRPAHPTRRRFSYNLRSLFVLIAAVSPPVGWLAYERRQSRHELQIAEQLETSGMGVYLAGRFDDFSPEPSSWWRRALSGPCGPRVQAMRSGPPNLLSDLSPLAGLKSLEALHLNDTHVSDLSPLVGLKDLVGLRFGAPQSATFLHSPGSRA